jgi:hypothetical protein
MTELIDILSTIVAIYPAEASANARAPYATYDLRETPIRTSEGIAGYEGTLLLSIYCATHAQAAEIADTIVSAIDAELVGKRKYYYADGEGNDYPDVGLVSRDLTFNTLR